MDLGPAGLAAQSGAVQKFAMSTLRYLFPDHLSTEISSLEGCDKKRDLIVMAELKEDFTNVGHHRKKLVFILSAMRHFAEDLRKQGYQVCYVALDDKGNPGNVTSLLERIYKEKKCDKIIVAHPGEYRQLQNVETLRKKLDVEVREDLRFYCTLEAFKTWAGEKKSLRMETFYRKLRREHDVLMHEGDPVGDEWNFDKENRKSLKSGKEIPPRHPFPPDRITKEVIALVEKQFAKHFGDMHPFQLAVTRADALKVLKEFIEERLVHFGEFQDAMLQEEAYLYHSVISYYLNCGLLLPREVCSAATDALERKRAPLNSVEGFVRQILGWREFIRGIYWLKMPGYAEQNHLEATRALPPFYWSGKTDMNCMRQVVEQTRQNAYSHHIQRLMVTGNFALLAGLHPKEVCEWYLAVYADAYEWVELPNTLGMSLFGDGGLFASKPYAASGKYINRMSNYCKECRFDPNVSHGEKACPFNVLYWHFMWRHREKLSANMRVKFAYATLRRMHDKKREEILQCAEEFLDGLPTY